MNSSINFELPKIYKVYHVVWSFYKILLQQSISRITCDEFKFKIIHTLFSLWDMHGFRFLRENKIK